MANLAIAISNFVSNTFGVDVNEEAFEQLKHDLANITVKCYRDDKSVPLPKYGHYDANGRALDGCCDLVCKSVEVTTDGRIKCGTGLHIALNDNEVLTIRPNSRITKKGLVIANSPCTIDECYRGEIFIVFRPITKDYKVPEIGEVIGQCHITYHPQITWEEVDSLEALGTTERGDGGFGSTENK